MGITKHTCIHVCKGAIAKTVKRKNSGGKHEVRLGHNLNSYWAVTKVRKVLTAVTAQKKRKKEGKCKSRNPTNSSLLFKNGN